MVHIAWKRLKKASKHDYVNRKILSSSVGLIKSRLFNIIYRAESYANGVVLTVDIS